MKSDEIRMEVLLLFLLNLTIRWTELMVSGEIAWADDTAVEGASKAFYAG